MTRKAASISAKTSMSEKSSTGAKEVPSIVVQPGQSNRTVRLASGEIMEVPPDWELLPPGDPMWTRRVKARTDHLLVQEKVGRKLFSRGLWASSEVISSVKREIDAERSEASYSAKLEKAAERRAEQQSDYVLQFEAEVARFLKFAPRYARLEQQMAAAIAAHATPVGSGTVARTQRIPVEKRAESAVIAWMRHQTTAYDNMKIARQRGARREVRRELAGQSRFLLDRYRSGKPVMEDCPLQEALEKLSRGVPPSQVQPRRKHGEPAPKNRVNEQGGR
ncbi:MAG: DUF2293 domain-containing protein [Planctomycetes bacterium]|nr:DUF2293 domain-containing protein [Planctomycetota bacterium]